MENTNGSSSMEITPNMLFLLQLHRQCMDIKSRLSTPTPNDGAYCPTVFDGWLCWNSTEAGVTANQSCPGFVLGFDDKRFARRECWSNGSWFRHPESGLTWTNYTSCVDKEDLRRQQIINALYITGYVLSLVALLVSLTIFLYFRSLRCTRISIHVRLFASLILNNVVWLIWYWLITEPETLIENDVMCQLFHLLTMYFMISNYMWMFCESLHLHLALVIVFVREEVAMRWFNAIGWLLPAILVGSYASYRYFYQHSTQYCWTGESGAILILSIPVLLSILISLMFLLNGMRILLTKLHANSTNRAPIGIKKAVRAALILMPLFGLHYLFIPVSPENGTNAAFIYQIFAALIVSLQGVCVSVLFCFINMDVHAAFKSYYSKMRRSGTSSTVHYCSARNAALISNHPSSPTKNSPATAVTAAPV